MKKFLVAAAALALVVGAPQADTVKVGFVYVGPVGDHGWSYQHDQGRKALEAAAGVNIDPKQWRDGFHLCLLDLAVNRFMLFLMAHTFRHYRFLERATRNLRQLIRTEYGR